VSDKIDYRKMRLEALEDEKIFKTKPVLLTQREIQAMLAKRAAKGERRQPHDFAR